MGTSDRPQNCIDGIRCPAIKGLPRETVHILHHSLVGLVCMQRSIEDKASSRPFLGCGTRVQKATASLAQGGVLALEDRICRRKLIGPQHQCVGLDAHYDVLVVSPSPGLPIVISSDEAIQ